MAAASCTVLALIMNDPAWDDHAVHIIGYRITYVHTNRAHHHDSDQVVHVQSTYTCILELCKAGENCGNDDDDDESEIRRKQRFRNANTDLEYYLVIEGKGVIRCSDTEEGVRE